MTAVTIELPDTLRQRAEKVAAERGDTIGDLLQELLEEYLEEVEDVREAAEILARIDAGEERTYSHQEVWGEQDIHDSPDEMIAKIKALPSNPASVHHPTQSLVELLSDTPSDPSFDEEAWNREWAAVEAEMKAMTQLLTTDNDFKVVPQLKQENWLLPSTKNT
jgi:predicted DNA-binding protein